MPGRFFQYVGLPLRIDNVVHRTSYEILFLSSLLPGHGYLHPPGEDREPD